MRVVAALCVLLAATTCTGAAPAAIPTATPSESAVIASSVDVTSGPSLTPTPTPAPTPSQTPSPTPLPTPTPSDSPTPPPTPVPPTAPPLPTVAITQAPTPVPTPVPTVGVIAPCSLLTVGEVQPFIPPNVGAVSPTQYRNNVCQFANRSGTGANIALSVLGKNDYRLGVALTEPSAIRVSGLGDLAVYAEDITIKYAILWVVKGDVAVAIEARDCQGANLGSMRGLGAKVLSRI